MNLGLYDIDLHHAPSSVPNLELMKIYNYYYKTNQPVTMMRPRDDFGRFDKIIFFKENPLTKIPNDLEISGNNRICYGTGFYGKIDKLPDKICAAAPSFLPYDIYSNKFKNYEKIRKNSLLRLENNDRTGLIPDAKIIYIVDRNPAYQENLIHFLKEERNEKIDFFHSLEIKDEPTYESLKKYAHRFCNRRFFINFNFSKDFFLNHLDKDFVYSGKIRQNESLNNFKIRLLSMILIKKKYQAAARINYIDQTDEILKRIIDWHSQKTNLSFSTFYKDDRKIQSEISKQISEVRSLLKQNPEKLNTEYLDF